MDYHTNLHLFHVFLVSALFIYVGIYQKSSIVPNSILLALGIIILAYHLYRHASWVNYFHILIVAPLLIFIGMGDAPRYAYELLFMLGFAALGYHGYYLLN
jgi:hypothetical protein